MPLKLGVQLESFGRSAKSALAKAANLGVDGVEIAARGDFAPTNMSRTAVRQFRKLLDDAGLTVTAVTFRTRRGYDVLDALDRRVQATRDAMRMAYELGAPIVINHVGDASADENDPKRSLLIDVLNDLAAYGQQVGAILAADTGPDDGRQLAALLDQVTNGVVAANLDPAGIFINNHSVSESIDALGDRIWHVYANDATRDLARRQGYQVQLGRGSVDFPAVLAALEEHTYRGFFTIAHQEGPDAVDQISDAISYLRAA